MKRMIVFSSVFPCAICEHMCICTCVKNKHVTLEVWRGQKLLTCRRRDSHLSFRKRGVGGERLPGQVSITLAVYCSLTVNLTATDHSAESTSGSPRLFCLTGCTLLTLGPRKLLFHSLVQQIHTDALGRRAQREKGFPSTCPPTH